MCGLYGWIGKNNVSESEMITLGNTMWHRGPNDGGFIIKQNFGLGFRRLSILDLSPNGHQPMSIKHGQVHIAFNGEIYNHHDLEKKLLLETKLFSTSDTEILINLFDQIGESCLNLLNGMFAFCFVNEITGEFFLVRDRLGVKPMYYGIMNGVLYFASELPTLMNFGFEKKVNISALNKYVRFGNIASPETIYDGIFKLEQGAYLKGNLNNPSYFNKKKWWTLPNMEDKNFKENQWVDKIDELLFDATQIRLIADVPTGIFLSGGIDSSLVAHYASVQNGFNKPKAITVIFDEEEFSEYQIAKEVAQSKSLDLVTLKIKSDSLNNLENVLNNIGEPFSDSSIINQFNLSREAQKHATVFLTGDGGDEAFAGYVEYVKASKIDWKIQFASKLSNIIYSPLAFLLKDDTNLKQQIAKLSVGEKYFGSAIRMNFREPILEKLINKAYKVKEATITEQIFEEWEKSEGLPLAKRMQIHDYSFYMEPDVLIKVDRATMANSIEARSPFLDYRVVELGLSIPNSFNIVENKGKSLLRQLAKRHLPESVYNAPKKGFGLPIKSWITEELKLHVYNLVNSNNHGFWDKNMVKFVIENANTPKYDMDTIFWRVWMFEIWYKTNIKN
jgi:asparagine synthase (glutamine-hydrolysing)